MKNIEDYVLFIRNYVLRIEGCFCERYMDIKSFCDEIVYDLLQQVPTGRVGCYIDFLSICDFYIGYQYNFLKIAIDFYKNIANIYTEYKV